MYQRYSNMKGVPAGVILSRIMKEAGMSQNRLSSLSGVYPQHIYEIIKGKRKFTVGISLNIEKVLNISERGFFYLIQARYEVDKKNEEIELQQHPDIQIFDKSLFWDVDFDKLNWQNSYNWIIRRVFEYGTESEILEIINYYGKAKIKAVLELIKDDWKSDSRTKNIENFLN